MLLGSSREPLLSKEANTSGSPVTLQTATMAEELKLFGKWSSPFSRRIEVALRLKGVQFEYIEEDLSNKSAELLNYNPVHKKVPVLVHNGKPIAESLVILEYIDETWQDNPILPADPYEKAMERFYTRLIDEKVKPITLFFVIKKKNHLCLVSLSVSKNSHFPQFWATIWPAAKKAMTSRGREQEEAIGEAQQHLETLERALKGKALFEGGKLGFVEISANVLLWLLVAQEAMEVGILTEEFPTLYGLCQRLADNAIFMGCFPPREKLIASCKAQFGAMTSSK